MKKSLMLAVLIVAILAISVSSAFADTVVVPGTGSPNSTATDTVTVKATVNSKLTLTVITTDLGVQTVDFGAVDPGVAQAAKTVSLNVKSNKTYNLTVVKAGDATIGLTTSLPATTGGVVTASQPYTDTYNLTAPWTTAPGVYTATVQYTVLQF